MLSVLNDFSPLAVPFIAADEGEMLSSVPFQHITLERHEISFVYFPFHSNTSYGRLLEPNILSTNRERDIRAGVAQKTSNLWENSKFVALTQDFF